MSGWIKLHRGIIDWEWYDDINTSRLFLHLLLIANHKDKNWRGILIKKGQKLTSQIKLADETGLTRQQVRSSLNKLKSTNDITIETSSQSTVITVINWNKYQTQPAEQPTDNQRVTNEQPTDNQRVTTNKKVKNENNEKNDKKNLVVDKFSTDHMKFAKGMFLLILNVAEKTKEPNFNKWADDVRKMNKIDNYDLEEMSQVFKWANSNSFWQTNILSPSKLRDKYSNLQAKMKLDRGPDKTTVTSSNIESAQRFLNRG